MRILIVSEDIDRSERDLFTAFRRAGHAVTVLCHPEETWQGSLRGAGVASDLRAAGIDVGELIVRHRLDRRAVKRIRRELAKSPVDIVYAPLNKTLSTSLIATRGSATHVVGYRGTLGHISRWDPACWLTYLHPRLDRILCVSDAVRRYLVSVGVQENRPVTVYKGHDPSWYDNVAPIALSSISVEDNPFVLAFTGNVRPVKGVDVLLEAVRQLPDTVALKLVLVGDVRDESIQQMLAKPEIAPRAIATGYRTDALSIVAASDAYVMPSVEREGLPRGVIEAMCLRKPVVVSDVGGLPELVEDGVSGLVVPPRDPAALAGAVAELANDSPRCKSLGDGARKRIEQAFHIRQTIDHVLGLFESLATDGPARQGEVRK